MKDLWFGMPGSSQDFRVERLVHIGDACADVLQLNPNALHAGSPGFKKEPFHSYGTIRASKIWELITVAGLPTVQYLETQSRCSFPSSCYM